jgi:DNA-binding MarR family transcriptional regulator
MRPEPESLKKSTAHNCARQIVETVPVIMRLIRSGVREKGGTLSMPQVRVLGLLSRYPGSSVSDVAAHLDVAIPTASALVDRLVKKHLVQRKDDPAERRRTMLTVTPAGKDLLEESRSGAQEFVVHLLELQTPEQLSKISEGLALLASAADQFSSPEKKIAHVKTP